MQITSIIQQIFIWGVPLIFAITLHEAAHAWAAYCLGDPTAKLLGRVSANPIRHIDLFGTLLLPAFMLLVTHFSFAFGWAKPVPMNIHAFKKKRRDAALVALAGPAANIFMALLWAILIKGAIFLGGNNAIGDFLFLMGQAGILLNVVLGVLNCLPLPPLDGSKMLGLLLPNQYADLLLRYEAYGLWILLLLVITGILGKIMMPLVAYVIYGIVWLFQL